VNSTLISLFLVIFQKNNDLINELRCFLTLLGIYVIKKISSAFALSNFPLKALSVAYIQAKIDLVIKIVTLKQLLGLLLALNG